MQVKVKDSKGTVQVVTVEGSSTVAVLKKAAAEKYSLGSDLSLIKLIFRGKLLQDDKTLDSYEIKEDSVIVLMTVKKTPEQLQAEKDYEDHKPAVDQLEMAGYSREEAITALRNNNWDIDKALDELEAGEEEFEDDEGQDEVDVAIEKFLTDPQFKGIRDQIRENPDNVRTYLGQLQQLHPELHEKFTSNPGLVEEVLEEVLAGSDYGGDGQDLVEFPEGEQDEWVDDDQLNQIGLVPPQAPPNAQITAADENNIIYLMGLGGYSRPQCIEAYLACDKNIEMAANFLLDGGNNQ